LVPFKDLCMDNIKEEWTIPWDRPENCGQIHWWAMKILQGQSAELFIAKHVCTRLAINEEKNMRNFLRLYLKHSGQICILNQCVNCSEMVANMTGFWACFNFVLIISSRKENYWKVLCWDLLFSKYM
jgi:hypothetical protein